jgi:hypothetical protein
VIKLVIYVLQVLPPINNINIPKKCFGQHFRDLKISIKKNRIDTRWNQNQTAVGWLKKWFKSAKSIFSNFCQTTYIYSPVVTSSRPWSSHHRSKSWKDKEIKIILNGSFMISFQKRGFWKDIGSRRPLLM